MGRWGTEVKEWNPEQIQEWLCPALGHCTAFKFFLSAPKSLWTLYMLWLEECGPCSRRTWA